MGRQMRHGTGVPNCLSGQDQHLSVALTAAREREGDRFGRDGGVNSLVEFNRVSH